MVGVKIYFFFSDKRQVIKKIDISKYFEKYFPNSNFGEKNVWFTHLPLDSWLIQSEYSDFGISTSTIHKDTDISVTSGCVNLYYWSLAFNKLNWGAMYFPVDLALWKTSQKLQLQVISSCFFKKDFIHFISAAETNKLMSLSRLFTGFSWVEREAKEFFHVYFIGLKDSRRLLTDYTNLVGTTDSYKTKGYDQVIQDLYY